MTSRGVFPGTALGQVVAELERLRDAVWRGGDPWHVHGRFGVFRVCVFCGAEWERWGGRVEPAVHRPDCPWLSEDVRRSGS